MRAEDFFHSGFVVDDFEGTLERLTGLFGYRWGEEIRIESTFTLADNQPATVESAFCYSLGEPRVEVLRTIPGTVWEPADSGIHHLGYWSDDVQLDSAALVAAGYEFELCGPGGHDEALFAYHRHANGPRIELVSRDVAPMFEQYWADGRNPFG
ncbi:MAG: VOC family protein [Actinomycetia bacterium]|nr:VOC family protein [Actinomycetes bacterium]